MGSGWGPYNFPLQLPPSPALHPHPDPLLSPLPPYSGLSFLLAIPSPPPMLPSGLCRPPSWHPTAPPQPLQTPLGPLSPVLAPRAHLAGITVT